MTSLIIIMLKTINIDRLIFADSALLHVSSASIVDVLIEVGRSESSQGHQRSDQWEIDRPYASSPKHLE